jgi:superfamily II DNA/RNA helicase
LTTATYDESSLSSLKSKFFLTGEKMEEINLNKQLQVVQSIKQFYLFFPLLYKDFYFVELIFHELDRTFGEPITASPSSNRKIVIFFNECKKCHYWYKVLKQMGLSVSVVHSYLKQYKRNSNLLKFIAGETEVLLATDLASRGLDLKNVHLVVNYDLPKNPKGKGYYFSDF